jgi:nitronate monooxygenase
MEITMAEPANLKTSGLKNSSCETTRKYPAVIQGGMGAGVSNWRLARAVARAGQMGVVSGTAIDLIMARRLQEGDPGGHMRRALDRFPDPEIAGRVCDRYFIPGGKQPDKPYKSIPRYCIKPKESLLELTMVANFAEVWLAKEGHNGLVGINLLEKIQLPNMASLYGAMLAGVDFVLMGAGIPREIPGVIDRLARHEEASLRIHVADAPKDECFQMRFEPQKLIPRELPPLKRPEFLAIVSSVTLALTLMKKSNGKVDGFIVEGASAGGHNAPPRGPLQLQENGEPSYGPKDVVDLSRIKDMGLPFWVAGSCADPVTLRKMKAEGAQGVQAGTLFAFCEESGLAEDIKRVVCQKAVRGEARIFTDPFASPTRFPFKIVRLEGSVSEKETYEERPRMCDLGYLQEIYRRGDGTLGHRCAAEPVAEYLKKGGDSEETEGRKCLCNALLANIGLPQLRRSGYSEKPLVTSGDDVNEIARFLENGKTSYNAREVVQYLLGQ